MSYEDDHYEPPPRRRGYGSAPQPSGHQPFGGDEPAVFPHTAYQPPVFDENAADPWNPNGTAALAGEALPVAVLPAEGMVYEGTVNEDLDLDRLDPKGRATRAGLKRRTGKSGVSRKRKIIKWTALGTAGLLAVVLGVGAYVVMHLDGNIKHTALLPTGVTQSAEIPDKFGNTAMNILLIGTDARVTAADCSLGGDCSSSGSGNSDVMMVIHLSADRTNATIMSIPRDTMTNIPDCGTNSAYYGMINSSLAYGAACTVATVHQMTGLTIDHYMEVDFSGVVTMSDALGGVPVCVSNNMYDKDSGLRLSAGTTTIEGTQALEFVRTRHGFYDGSDLGREKAQHIFLSDMIRTLRSKTSLTNLANLYTIADAATKSLQVDNGLAGVTNLISLFDTMNKVPTNRTTFVTMPWELDPSNTNRVIEEPGQAQQMFTNIKNDVSYSSASSTDSSSTKSETDSATSTATAEASPSATSQQASADSGSSVITSEVHAQILNGTGVSGRASTVSQALVSGGFSSANLSTGDANSTSKTMVYYPSGRSDSAAAVADALGIPSSQVQESSSYSEVTVVVGSDWTSGTTYTSTSSSSGSTGTSTATTAATAPSESS